MIYRGVGKRPVRLIGGRRLSATDFAPITDPATLARVQTTAQGKVLMLDLEKLGLKHIASYPEHFTDNGGIVELFVDNRRMPLSRYPNKIGEMTIKRVLVNGGGQEKPGDWRDYYNSNDPAKKRALEIGPPRPGVFEYREEHADAHQRRAKQLDRGVWIKGYWRVVWQNEAVRIAELDTAKGTIKLAVPLSNGIGSKYHRPEGSGEEVYWAMNLLEEIDQPGEWAIDFVDKRLYFYPPGPLGDASILISDTASPVIDIEDSEFLAFENLVVEGSLGHGIRVRGGQSVAILGCTVRNVAKYGVWIEGGTRHLVRSCDLYALGAGGVWLSGGDSEASPRVPAEHRVTNNDIHHFGQIERVYAPGVNVGFIGGGGGSKRVHAVGMRVANNVIHHCPHAGVLFNSFDNVFEYNEVFQYALVSNDMGAFYSYSKENGIGNTTFRYNFMHSSPEGDGVYFDNLADGPTIVGNVAYRLGPQTADVKAKRGCGFLIKNFGEAPIQMHNNIAVDCKEGYFARWAESSTIRDNVSVSCGKAGDVPNVKNYDVDPGFVAAAKLDFRLRGDSRLWRGAARFRANSLRADRSAERRVPHNVDRLSQRHGGVETRPSRDRL